MAPRRKCVQRNCKNKVNGKDSWRCEIHEYAHYAGSIPHLSHIMANRKVRYNEESQFG